MQPNTQLIMGKAEQGTASTLTQHCVSHVDHMHVHVLALCTHSSTHVVCYIQTNLTSPEDFCRNILPDAHMPII